MEAIPPSIVHQAIVNLQAKQSNHYQNGHMADYSELEMQPLTRTQHHKHNAAPVEFDNSIIEPAEARVEAMRKYFDYKGILTKKYRIACIVMAVLFLVGAGVVTGFTLGFGSIGGTLTRPGPGNFIIIAGAYPLAWLMVVTLAINGIGYIGLAVSTAGLFDYSAKASDPTEIETIKWLLYYRFDFYAWCVLSAFNVPFLYFIILQLAGASDIVFLLENVCIGIAASISLFTFLSKNGKYMTEIEVDIDAKTLMANNQPNVINDYESVTDQKVGTLVKFGDDRYVDEQDPRMSDLPYQARYPTTKGLVTHLAILVGFWLAAFWYMITVALTYPTSTVWYAIVSVCSVFGLEVIRIITMAAALDTSSHPSIRALRDPFVRVVVNAVITALENGVVATCMTVAGAYLPFGQVWS